MPKTGTGPGGRRFWSIAPDKKKVSKVEKTTIGTHHVFAECRDCKKSWDDYLTAAAQARKHAASTGHTVHVERGQGWTYNPKF